MNPIESPEGLVPVYLGTDISYGRVTHYVDDILKNPLIL